MTCPPTHVLQVLQGAVGAECSSQILGSLWADGVFSQAEEREDPELLTRQMRPPGETSPGVQAFRTRETSGGTWPSQASGCSVCLQQAQVLVARQPSISPLGLSAVERGQDHGT